MTNDDKRKHFRVIQQTDDLLAKPSAEQMKQLYMASSHLEWGTFARSMGWNAETAEQLNSHYDAWEWVTKKKEILAREQAEQIAELVFDHKSRWHRDVLKTLKDYPEANDAVLAIIKRRINDIVRVIREDESRGAGANGEFKKVQTKELLALASAMKTVTEAKHKSLMIDNWNIQIADKFSEPIERLESDLTPTSWKIEVIGGEKLDTKQMQEFMSRYYDKPQLHSPDELLKEAE